ncbi:DNA-packaging protein FI [Cronobacter turicensis]|uniref:DNA-packaging protein FI n=2 Tax=Enterobacteriaceae TaxID=543 RepID=UPI0024C391FC|nr:DNA-packaging protein FI [Cronobacter turicensis]MDK1186548.1 DNA-packaging protein FI [Cronobacter turicensis]MDK1216791.1 DNA-packaging protein FI [Cronobacter turicensis]MDK1220951.1 DNA-packaging protein FI [Cronobacter turicensis]MDK1233786.1 DNA-packaging protein FI [Cronobacter turicensis]
MTERLKALAVILGREAEISGSKADLEQRLAEWEEEAAGYDEEGTGQDDTHDESVEEHREEAYSERTPVRLRMLKTAHMPACDATTGKMLTFAPAGRVVLVNASVVPALLADGLAEKFGSGDV